MTDYDLAESLVRRVAEEAGICVEQVVLPSEETPFSFVVEIPSSMTPERVNAFCRSCGEALHQEIPENANQWAWCILVTQSGQPFGAYFGGWVGRKDQWQEEEAREDGESESMEWEELYNKILANLIRLGRNDATGDGDFWLLDDDYGSCMQKICIFRIEILTTALVGELQSILKSGYSRWSIQIVLELLPPDEDVSHEGIEIFADRVEEHWDRAMLRARFRSRFRA
jgi:hypothetical protein